MRIGLSPPGGDIATIARAAQRRRPMLWRLAGSRRRVMTYWEFRGRELANCTCEYGCNCQFNALPDKGHCHAVAAVQIDEGHHGDTRLDGLTVVGIFKWPGPVHEGNGEALPQIVLPDGFEYEVANIGSGSSQTLGGPMNLEIESKYAQFANLHLSTHGVVRG